MGNPSLVGRRPREAAWLGLAGSPALDPPPWPTPGPGVGQAALGQLRASWDPVSGSRVQSSDQIRPGPQGLHRLNVAVGCGRPACTPHMPGTHRPRLGTPKEQVLPKGSLRSLLFHVCVGPKGSSREAKAGDSSWDSHCCPASGRPRVFHCPGHSPCCKPHWRVLTWVLAEGQPFAGVWSAGSKGNL